VIAHGGELSPDLTVAGYLARRREVRGVCRQRDCRRSCEIDCARLAQQGLGALRVHELKPLFKCARLGGCALEFHEQYGHELTLAVLARLERVHLRISCAKCRKPKLVRPAAVVARLIEEGTGGHDTPLEKLAGLIRGACPACQTKRWEVAAFWLDRIDCPPGRARWDASHELRDILV
jgi:hypothetical protein